MNQTEFSACDDREFLSVQYESGKLVLTPQGEIDHHSAAPLRERMDHFLYRYRPQSCCIDLAKNGIYGQRRAGAFNGAVYRGGIVWRFVFREKCLCADRKDYRAQRT